jgi:hypothetical protein
VIWSQVPVFTASVLVLVNSSQSVTQSFSHSWCRVPQPVAAAVDGSGVGVSARAHAGHASSAGRVEAAAAATLRS